jgi:hypothetical protein
MKTTKILGIGLLVAAGAVGYMGYSESQGLGSALSSTFEGTPGDSVLIKYVAATVLAGLGIFFIRK